MFCPGKQQSKLVSLLTLDSLTKPVDVCPHPLQHTHLLSTGMHEMAPKDEDGNELTIYGSLINAYGKSRGFTWEQIPYQFQLNSETRSRTGIFWGLHQVTYLFLTNTINVLSQLPLHIKYNGTETPQQTTIQQRLFNKSFSTNDFSTN